MNALSLLAGVNGNVSINDGIATLPDGTTIDLGALTFEHPRVLVIVSGGVADSFHDSVVDVEIYDFDNHANGQDSDVKLPAHFADLARDANVPEDMVESE